MMQRIPRASLAVILVACLLPRLIALGRERGTILAGFVDKSDTFAQNFLADGTYGFIPHIPSAYTQPLYGFFLVPLYWIAGRHWETVGLAHIALALAVSLLVYLLARKMASERVALLSAVLVSIHPYLVWHDVHMNREILDNVIAVLLVLLTLRVAQRATAWGFAALGVVYGLAILSNVRLTLLPVVLLGFVLLSRRRVDRALVLGTAVFLASAAVVVMPWVIRNEVQVGCLALTTDGRGLWKANNENTYRVLTHGGWIDHVPVPASYPPSAQDAFATYRDTGRIVPVDECAQQAFYQHLVFEFWKDDPVEKLKLVALGNDMLWSPWVTETEGRPGAGTWLDTARQTSEPLFAWVVYLFAAVGLFALPRRFVLLFAGVFAYQSLTAAIFMGATRYRVPWDFLLAILAAAGFARVVALVRDRRRRSGTGVAA